MHNHSYENEFNLHVNEISFSYEKKGIKTRFEEEAEGNSEMVYYGTAEKLLFMRSRLRFVFPPFHFQNGGRRIKNQHGIVVALGSILLARGFDKYLGYFGQSPVQMF